MPLDRASATQCSTLIRFLATGFLALLVGCSSPADDPMAEIEKTIDLMQAALAEQDNGAFSDHLADSFLGGPNGSMHMNKADVRKALTGYFLRFRNIHVVVTQLDIEIDEAEPSLARMNGKVALAGANRSLPESGGIYTVEGDWQQYSGKWKLRSFSWR